MPFDQLSLATKQNQGSHLPKKDTDQCHHRRDNQPTIHRKPGFRHHNQTVNSQRARPELTAANVESKCHKKKNRPTDVRALACGHKQSSKKERDLPEDLQCPTLPTHSADLEKTRTNEPNSQMYNAKSSQGGILRRQKKKTHTHTKNPDQRT